MKKILISLKTLFNKKQMLGGLPWIVFYDVAKKLGKI